MSAALTLEIETLAFEKADCDLAIAGLFPDDRPLRGAAGRADWRLCGLASRLIAEGRMSGEAGDALLVPTRGRLRAGRVMLLGLGPRDGFQRSERRAATRDAVERALRLGAARLALAPLGIARGDFPRHAETVLDGALEAVRGQGAPLTLRLVLPSRDVRSALRALEMAVSAGRPPEVTVRIPASVSDSALAGPSGRARTQPGGPHPRPGF